MAKLGFDPDIVLVILKPILYQYFLNLDHVSTTYGAFV